MNVLTSFSSLGEMFKNEGVLNVCLDTNNGTLSFGMNDEGWGVAFTSDDLKSGDIYPAVALINSNGCKLAFPKYIPGCFL